jgi:hypothetical protein
MRRGQYPGMIRFIRNLLMATTIHDGEEKVKNAIAFFASEHERLTQKPLAVTSLYKYLALLDASLRKVAHPTFEPHFRRMGRKLTDPYERRETRKDDCFVVIPREGEYVVKATRNPDLSYFYSFELDEMNKLVRLNALTRVLHKRFSSLETDDTKRLDEVNADFLDDTREEAWAEIKNAVMDVSERSFFTKRKEVDEMTSLNLLIEKYETRLKELETAMAEVKRKLEVVIEASRLLTEEGLSEDEPRPRWP